MTWYRPLRERSSDIYCFSSAEQFPPSTDQRQILGEPYALNNHLFKSLLPASHPDRSVTAPIQVRQSLGLTPLLIGTGGEA